MTFVQYTRYSVFVQKESLILIGMAGAGKSTIGRLLASTLGFSFTDLDDYIREKEAETIQSIIDRLGEAALLLIEERRTYEIDLKHRVIAPGGSIIYRPALMDYLKQRAILVFLDEPFEIIRERLKNAASRGIVGYRGKSLQQIYLERHPLYVKYADITIEPQGKSPAQVVAEIIDHYNSM
ncbi:MAG TPA: shikimate kinase [Dehalococcoidales bacterium]